MAKPPAGKTPAAPITPPAASASSSKAAGAPTPDWERIELDYRAGIKTLRQIAEEHGITHGAINKRAKRDGWERDLSEKIQAKADALVSKAMVSSEVSADTRAREQEVVNANAQAVAEVRLAHRRDIHRARRLTNALLDELEGQTDPDTLVLLDELGDLLRSPDEKTGRDRLNELYQAVISLPERSKTMKVLAESLQKLVDMERQAFGMDAKNPAGEGAQSTRDMTDAERAVRVAAVLNGGGAPALLEALRARRSGA
ncbi:hypothetical protein [Pulveribacter sp.]|uniref:hypothetical protein n=1 Tax=Pulveribacter sp. TaxID=2678893 RepID=UPI0028B1F456|nr:hypothetical protein [Pulveribacter sp.]